MRASEGFVLGAITGAVVLWCWGDKRPQAAAVKEGPGKVCDCGGADGAARRTTAFEDWSCLIVGLFGLAARLWGWHHSRTAMSAVRPRAAA
jgi:hypothetical protein